MQPDLAFGVAIALDGEPARDEPAIVLNTYSSTKPVRRRRGHPDQALLRLNR